jgi:hypothetical protein
MPSYSPELIQTMRAALDEVMTKIPVDQATPRVKAHMAKFILKAAAEGQTSYDRLLASASDKISASETLIRYLGPSEAYFWLSNQNSWKHFVVAAQITGETTTASWRTALDAVQRRHPLLGVCIDADDSGAPYFRPLPELRIPLQIVPGDALQGWEDEMRRFIGRRRRSLPVDLSPLILGSAGGQGLRLPDGRRRCRSLRGRLDLGFGELAP